MPGRGSAEATGPRDLESSRVALLIAYDGTDFHGFARQNDRRTVQGLLEERLSTLLRVPVGTVGAGRTDAGVHAAGQVVSFDAPARVDPAWLRARLNRWLAPEIAVRAAARVPADFSARFGARRRAYEYRLYLAPEPDPFLDRFSLWWPHLLYVPAMRAAAGALIGEHDFSSFSRRGEGSSVRRVRAIAVSPRNSIASSGSVGKGSTHARHLFIRIEADSFCHQMVRGVVGTLIRVGEGRCPPEEMSAILAARDRAKAGPVAPARGLTLVRVRYSPDPFRGTRQ